LVGRLILAVMRNRDDGRVPPRRTSRDKRIERGLLLAVLDAPEYGGFVSDLARRLGEPEEAITAAAAGLEERGLVYVGNRYVAASGCALDTDALWPLAI
jgi:hypothetical protein